MATIMENLVAFFKFMGNFFKYFFYATLYLLKAIFLFFIPKCLRFKDVSHDIVLITGGASGLGRLMAIKFAKLGAKVIIWDLNLAGLEETAKMIEELRSKRENVGKCHYYQVDISNKTNIYVAAERIKQEIGSVSILVNNAGVVTGKRFLECSDEQISKTFDVNVLAHFWLLKAFLPSMMEKNHGHIVSIASIAGQIGSYQLTDYSSSKFAAVGLEESLSLELLCDGYDGIHSTLVCPYYIRTGMFDGVGRSFIPILTPQYVVDETVKAVLVNQEVLCLPSICYFLLLTKHMFPTKTFLYGHRAIGGASTMKTFTGRQVPQKTNTSNQMNSNDRYLLSKNDKSNDATVTIKMTPPDIGITIPMDSKPYTQQLNQ